MYYHYFIYKYWGEKKKIIYLCLVLFHSIPFLEDQNFTARHSELFIKLSILPYTIIQTHVKSIFKTADPSLLLQTVCTPPPQHPQPKPTSLPKMSILGILGSLFHSFSPRSNLLSATKLGNIDVSLSCTPPYFYNILCLHFNNFSLSDMS